MDGYSWNSGFKVEVQFPVFPVLLQRNWAQMGREIQLKNGFNSFSLTSLLFSFIFFSIYRNGWQELRLEIRTGPKN